MTSTPAAGREKEKMDAEIACPVESSDIQLPKKPTANERPSGLNNQPESFPTESTEPKGKLQTVVLMIALCVCIFPTLPK